MNKKLLYGVPLHFPSFLPGVQQKQTKKNEPPKEDTENDVDDKDYKLDKEESDGNQN